jgi:hypothetical protein
MAVFFVAVLAEGAVSVDEVSDADISFDVALSGVIENRDLIPISFVQSVAMRILTGIG